MGDYYCPWCGGVTHHRSGCPWSILWSLALWLAVLVLLAACSDHRQSSLTECASRCAAVGACWSWHWVTDDPNGSVCECVARAGSSCQDAGEASP